MEGWVSVEINRGQVVLVGVVVGVIDVCKLWI